MGGKADKMRAARLRARTEEIRAALGYSHPADLILADVLMNPESLAPFRHMIAEFAAGMADRVAEHIAENEDLVLYGDSEAEEPRGILAWSTDGIGGQAPR